ncbi:hypothetical protein L596_013385 [Steinernema carpocapsae]|uniref:4Fe-4S ferredoxin-type domain-containing protein n=1 Tax=Steinernema carpocapsae TaxID=34508 RepID=A0A4U5P0H3_STECR|nr:hypothetical protein L596_013385 [Steinernema carpocapsae]
MRLRIERNRMTRITIINKDKCKPKNCGKKASSVVRQGKQCITVEMTFRMSSISEALCIRCGICTEGGEDIPGKFSSKKPLFG